MPATHARLFVLAMIAACSVGRSWLLPLGLRGEKQRTGFRIDRTHKNAAASGLGFHRPVDVPREVLEQDVRGCGFRRGSGSRGRGHHDLLSCTINISDRLKLINLFISVTSKKLKRPVVILGIMSCTDSRYGSAVSIVGPPRHNGFALSVTRKGSGSFCVAAGAVDPWI